jgi:cytosine deaminase
VDEAVRLVSQAKRGFTAEDVHERAARTLEKCIVNGATHVRTQLEVDPVVGLRSLDGILPLIEEYRFALDLEICVYPQEGLLNNPGTERLMRQALERGAVVVGADPLTDTDPHGQIRQVFEIARDHDVPIDMHIDWGADPSDLELDLVCRLTEDYGWGGRVAVGHVTRLSAAPPQRLEAAARRLAEAGVAVTVLPTTELYLMGRERDHDIVRGIAPAHRLLAHGVNCALSSNNIQNPFTPYGDCSLVRVANLYANVAQVSSRDDLVECFAMITTRPARLMGIEGYGLAVGNTADLVVLDAPDPAAVVAGIAMPLLGLKRGRVTFSRAPAELHRPA